MRWCWVAILSLYAYHGAAEALNETVERLSGSTVSATTTSAFGTTHGIGDYVASGIGIESTATASSTTSTSSSSRVANATTRSSSSPRSSIINLSNGTAVSHDKEFGNASSTRAILGLSQCWNQWSTFWDRLPAFSTYRETACISTSEVITYASTIFITMTRPDLTPNTRTTTWTGTRTIDNNGFAVSTYYRIDTWTITNTRSTKGTTFTSAASVNYTYVGTCNRAFSTTASARQPNCTLPSTNLPQCQTSWDSWVSTQLRRIEDLKTSNVSAAPAPSCTQASIAGETCASIKDAFVSSSLDLSYFSRILPANITSNGHPEDDVHWSGGYYSWWSDGWTWPPSTAFFAPSCTLGCGRCSIKGGTVDLLYWPPATTAAAGTNGSTPTTTAENLMVTTLGTTLASPSLYISYRSLYAEDACGKKIGTTIYDTILAIPAESTLQSIWGSVGSVDEYQTTDVYTSTASFNITDLYQDPVPMSIYSSQPWCAKWAYFYLWNNFIRTSWHCPHTEPYKPIIKVPEDIVKRVDPLWADCIEAYGGVYDPPLALTPASTAAGATLPNQEQTVTTPAAQASAPLPAIVPSTTALRAEVSTSDGPFVPAQPQPTADDIQGGSPTRGQDEDDDNMPPQQTQGDIPASFDDGVLQGAIESAVAAVQAGQTQQRQPDSTAATTSPAVLTIGSEDFTSVPGDGSTAVFANADTSFAIGPGVQAITVGSEVVSAAGLNEIVVSAYDAARTFTLAPAIGIAEPNAEVTVGSQVFGVEAGSTNVFFNADATFSLEAGAATQIGSHLVSATPDGIAIIVDGGNGATTVPLPAGWNSQIQPSKVAKFEIDGESYTAIADPRVTGVAVVDDRATFTLSGPGMTIDGHVVSLGRNGIVVDGTTYTWTSAGDSSASDEISDRSSSATATRRTSSPGASSDPTRTATAEGSSPGGPTSTSGATACRLSTAPLFMISGLFLLVIQGML